MSNAPPSAAPAPVLTKRKRSKVSEYIIVLIVVGIVVAIAFYQEPASAFFRLHLWDRDAPGRSVVNFLKAAKKGDQAEASAYVKSTNMNPLNKDGKWIGYFVVVMSAKMEIILDEIVPKDEPKPGEAEFNTFGKGAATVRVPNAKGQPVQYRLEMIGDGWKITDIRWGRPAK